MSNILWLGNKSIHNITHHQYWYSNHVQELANSKSSTYLFPEIPAVGRPLQHHPCPSCHHRQSPRLCYNRSPLFPHHCSDHQPNEHHHLCSWHQWLKIKIQITADESFLSWIYAPTIRIQWFTEWWYHIIHLLLKSLARITSLYLAQSYNLYRWQPHTSSNIWMTSFTCSSKQDSIQFCVARHANMQYWILKTYWWWSLCRNFLGFVVYVVNIQLLSSLFTHLRMTIALTWTIKAVTPHSNITTMRTIFWIGVSQTAWCLERCFSAITGHVIKQDGSSPRPKAHTTDVRTEHKNPCETKIKQCLSQPATSQFSSFYTTTSII